MSPGDSAGTWRFPGDRVPARCAIRSWAGMTDDWAADTSRRHSIRPAGISVRNLDCLWKEGRPHQFLASARVR